MVTIERKIKQVSPYTRLKSEAMQWMNKAFYPKERVMFGLLENGASYTLDDVFERMTAAETLGFEVVLKPSGEKGKFKIIYREKMPEIPYNFKY